MAYIQKRPHAHYVKRPGQSWRWISQFDADRLYAAMEAHPAAHEGVQIKAVELPHYEQPATSNE